MALAARAARRTAVLAVVLLLAAAAGCAGLSSGDSGASETGAGRVEMDLASRRHLEVTKHDATVQDGRVRRISVRWRNVSEDEVTARIRTVFHGPDGEVLRDVRAQWVTVTIPPGGTQGMQWSAPDGDAAGYVIRVRSPGWWPL
ncbi:MAG: hypothetical protein V5A84_03195 [Planctomycetota bacterium]